MLTVLYLKEFAVIIFFYRRQIFLISYCRQIDLKHIVVVQKIGLWAIVIQRFLSKSLKYVSKH